MNTTRNVSTIILLGIGLIATAGAQQSKQLESRLDVSRNQRIVLKGFNGAEFDVQTWDRPEAYVNVRVRFSSSNDEAEKEYIEQVRITQEISGRNVVFEFDQPSVDAGFSFKRLLSFKFNTYVRKEIKGEVFLPAENAFSTDLRYGKLKVDGVRGDLDIESRSSTIDVSNCSQISSIGNDYGTTTVTKGGGDARFENKSGKLAIEDFDGALDINAPYANVMVKQSTHDVRVRSQSGTVMLRNIGKNVSVHAPYSTVGIENIGGFVTLSNKSGSVTIEDVDGIEVDGPYSTIDVKNVRGKSKERMKISTQSGRIRLENGTGDLMVRAPYTNVSLKGVSGSVELESRSATVHAEDVRGDWNSRTQYSSVDLRGQGGNIVRIENNSGTVDVDLTGPVSQLEITNSYADVNIRTPKGLNAKLRLKAEYGSISSFLPVESEKMGSGAISIGTVGSGEGTFTVQTKSGNIRITEKR
jgi:hypothetical protein